MAVDGSAFVLERGDWSGAERSDGADTIVVTYGVKVTELADGPVVAATATGLPAIYATYSPGNDSNTAYYCISRDWQRSDNELVWQCSCTFSNVVPEPRDPDGNPSEDPETWQPKKELLFVQYQKEVKRALWERMNNGAVLLLRYEPGGGDQPVGAIINSAGVPVEPAPLMDDSRMMIRCTWWRRFIDANVVKQYRNATNSDGFTVTKRDIANNAIVNWQVNVAPDTAKMMEITIQDEQINGSDYLRITAAFAIDEEGWFIRETDKGLHGRACPGDDGEDWAQVADPDGLGGTIDVSDIVEAQPRVRVFLDAAGNQVFEPVQLDGNGKPLKCGADPVEIEWRVYPSMPFSAFLP